MQNDRSLDGVRLPTPQAARFQPAFSASTAVDALSSNPVEELTSEPTAEVFTPTKRRITARGALITAIIGVILLLIVGLWVALNNHGSPQVKSGEFGTVQIPLAQITSPNLNIDNAKSLRINGQLQVANSLVLSPTTQPSKAAAGQLYYDKTSNQLAFFNGQQFVNLNGGTGTGTTTNTTNQVTNITNVVGSSQANVALQNTAPGTQQTGNFNVSGTGQVSLLKTPVISSDGGTFYINPASGASQQQITPGTPATVGLTSGSSAAPGPGWANDLSATKIAMGSVGGTAKSISAFFSGGSASSHVQVGLFDDDGNVPSKPGNLLAQSAVGNLVPDGVTTLTIPAVNLSANTTYWLAVNTDDNTVGRTYDGGSKASCFKSSGFGFMPDPFGGCFFDNNNYTVYLNYTVGSGTSGSASQAQFVLSPTGQATFQNSADSTSGFQVQNSFGSALLDVDTINGRIGIGKSTPAYKLDVAGGDINLSNGHSLRFGGLQALSANSDGSIISLTNFNSGGTISAQADNFAIQDANATTTILSVNASSATVTVASLVVSATLTVNGHIVTGGSTPSIAAGTAACTTPTVSVNGTDTSGTITVTTGTGCSTGGTLATITFAAAYSAIPHVTLTAGNTNAAALNTYIDNSGTTTAHFVLATTATASGTTTYQWNYFAAQ